jgi:hypothetical protein
MTDAPQDSQPPHPSYLRGSARAKFESLDERDQRLLDEALMAIEWHPEPADAQELDLPNVFAVVRGGFVVSYEITGDGIDVWDILPRE